MADNVIHVGDEEFEAVVLQSDIPVLVDFYADWCGPCKMLAPKIEELAGAMEGQLKVVKVDVDQCPETAMTYGIRSIPTLLWFRGGDRVETLIGNQDYETLSATSERVIRG